MMEKRPKNIKICGGGGGEGVNKASLWGSDPFSLTTVHSFKVVVSSETKLYC